MSGAAHKYRVQAVAQRTGLSPALIRAWESRYGMVSPQRTPAGYRLYSDEDVALLLGARRLVEGGMAPMEVARLGREEILRRAAAGPPGPGPKTGLPPGLDFGERIEQVLGAFAALDRPRAEALIGPPLATLSIEDACRLFLVPLMVAVGERWHQGRLSVAGEHFGTDLLRGRLQAILTSLRYRPAARRVLCACPPEERHDVGLLMFALQAAAQGWDAIYLGADVPWEAMAEAVSRSAPDLVALSLAQSRPGEDLRRVLRLACQVAGGRPVLVGGRAVDEAAAMAREAGCLLWPPSGRLDELLPG